MNMPGKRNQFPCGSFDEARRLIAMVPMAGIGLVLSNKDCTFVSLVLLAGASGIGGGALPDEQRTAFSTICDNNCH